MDKTKIKQALQKMEWELELETLEFDRDQLKRQVEGSLKRLLPQANNELQREVMLAFVDIFCGGDDLGKTENQIRKYKALLKSNGKRLSPEQISVAKDVDPLSVAENLDLGRRRLMRDRVVSLCPFHNERCPSFNLTSRGYICWGCGERGDFIDLFMRLKNMRFSEAVAALARVGTSSNAEIYAK